MPKDDDRAVQALAENACPLGSAASDLDGLLAAVEGADFVLLGEATHGTREFYQLRCTITRRLVEEQGFDAVAVEADWPDAQRLNRFVRGISDEHPREAFSDFQRFPTWMWRNTDVLALVEWMRSHNEGRGAAAVGFYGIDLYSLYRSAEAVTEYLARRDPEAAERARRAYACLDHVREPQEYGFEAARGMRPDCGEAVRGLFERLEQERPHATGTGWSAADEYFHAEDAIGRWLEECCERNPQRRETSSALFKAWRRWCEENGEFDGSTKNFSTSLSNRGFTPFRSGKARGYRGLALLGRPSEDRP